MSISTPVANHPLQMVLWNQILVDAAAQGAPAFENKPEYMKLLDVEPHHHVPAIAFGVQTYLNRNYGVDKFKLEVEYDVDGLDRAVFRIVEGGYVAVEEADAKPAYSVDISYYVYTEAISTTKAPSAVDKPEAEDEVKLQRSVTKMDANIPVVFVSKDKKATRHYQESRPMHVYKGMTNLMLANLVKEITAFMLTGSLPPDVQ